MSQLLTTPIIERNLPPIQLISIDTYKMNLPISNIENAYADTENGFGICLRFIDAVDNNNKSNYLYYWLTPNDKEDDRYIINFNATMLAKATALDNIINDLKNNTTKGNKIKKAIGFCNNNGTPYDLSSHTVSVISSYEPIKAIKPKPQLYYKISVAFWTLECTTRTDSVATFDIIFSPWSTYGISKCIRPSLFNISFNVKENDQIPDEYIFESTYKNTDRAERETYYKVELLESPLGENSENSYKVCATIDKTIHKSNSDTVFSGVLTCKDTFSFPVSLDNKKQYKLQYYLYTISGFTKIVPSYVFKATRAVVPKNKVWLSAENKIHDGYVSIKMESAIGYFDPDLGPLSSISGRFLLLRASEEDNFKVWHKLEKIVLYTQFLPREIYRDYYTAQGVTYKYAVIQCITSQWKPTTEKIISESVVADFEHLYLCDSEHVLTIKYNPKVSTFKTVKLEGKTDTIGGKYPIFTRNGDTSYKQFAISGLISVFMDDNQLFGSHDDIYSWNLDGDNLKRERIFKLAVEEWLNNGKPKLFRSSVEGSYIIILQGISLTPEDKLGRMLHNFSATGYECAEYNLENLIEYNLIKSASGTKILNIQNFPLEILTANAVNYQINANKINLKGMKLDQAFVLNGNPPLTYHNSNLSEANLVGSFTSITLGSNQFENNANVEIISKKDDTKLELDKIYNNPVVYTVVLEQFEYNNEDNENNKQFESFALEANKQLVKFNKLCFWRKADSGDNNLNYYIKLNNRLINIDTNNYWVVGDEAANIFDIEISNGIAVDLSYDYINIPKS